MCRCVYFMKGCCNVSIGIWNEKYVERTNSITGISFVVNPVKEILIFSQWVTPDFVQIADKQALGNVVNPGFQPF